MIPVRQIDNCKFGKCYSPFMVRKQRALTIPLLCQINEDGDFNVIENNCNINDDNNNNNINNYKRNISKSKFHSSKHEAMIQKANLEKFPNYIIDNKNPTSKAFFHNSAKASDHLRLERISSGETLEAIRHRSFTK